MKEIPHLAAMDDAANGGVFELSLDGWMDE